mmetsp:Transcript_58419/g.137659  ORF Transcript_58419/g.137659 Transcript_58419/m.137659 type:complete len:280 (+) Transcript_58419:17-856(+)
MARAVAVSVIVATLLAAVGLVVISKDDSRVELQGDYLQVESVPQQTSFQVNSMPPSGPLQGTGCQGSICVTDTQAREIVTDTLGKSRRMKKKIKKLGKFSKRNMKRFRKAVKRQLNRFNLMESGKINRIRSGIVRLRKYAKNQILKIHKMRGPTGARGVTGYRGRTGPVGVRGRKGRRGKPGARGPKGVRGLRGRRGARGGMGRAKGLQCKRVHSGKSAARDDARVAATCPTGWRITGCTQHTYWKSMDGGFFSGNSCYAQNGAGGHGVWAYAMCCKIQ